MMDNEYIEMCKSATEIQEMWKPKIGDKIINQFQNEDIITFCGGTPHHWRIGTVETTQRGMLPQETTQNDLIWCPRQEDLQEIFNNNETPVHLNPHIKRYQEGIPKWFVMLFNWFFYEQDYVEQFKNDMTTLNLAFVMETLYNKRRNAENNKWELIE